MWTSTSSASGRTATVAVDVWMRPCDSVSGTRCTRWVPPSYLKTLYAPRPLTAKVKCPSPTTSGSWLKAAALGVAREHPVEVGGEQAGLLAASARTDLDDHVLVVVGIGLDHRQPDLLLELGEPVLGGAEHLAHLRVVAVLGEQLTRARGVVGHAAPLDGELVRGLELAVGAPDLGVAALVADHLRVRHLPRELREAALDLLHEPLNHREEGTRLPQSASSAKSIKRPK